VTTELQIRDATPDDAAGLVPLLATLGYPATQDVARERLATLLRDDRTARVLVALLQARIVGFATLHATPVLHRPTAVARVTALAVAPDVQGSGAGRALMAAAEQHFRAEGYQRIEVTSGPTHAPAHAFYRHLGYRDQGIRLARELR
jgi:GNAT superfamily N-acetyltransferase